MDGESTSTTRSGAARAGEYRIEQAQPFGPEEDDVRLQNVVLVEHDVERRGHRESA